MNLVLLEVLPSGEKPRLEVRLFQIQFLVVIYIQLSLPGEGGRGGECVCV